MHARGLSVSDTHAPLREETDSPRIAIAGIAIAGISLLLALGALFLFKPAHHDRKPACNPSALGGALGPGSRRHFLADHAGRSVEIPFSDG